MAIVTMSHEIGAGGPEIGQQLAERLGCRYVDHELISNAATRYGLLEEKLSHLDESKPSLFERFDAETRRYITVIQTALYDFAEQDNVVLMGRGGSGCCGASPRAARAGDGAVRRAGQAPDQEARGADGGADEPAHRHRARAPRRRREGRAHALPLRGRHHRSVAL
jgi:hypothetical protein